MEKNNLIEINTALVKELIAAQFPQFSQLLIKPVLFNGIDNKIFRLGEKLLVRLSSNENYALQVPKERS